MIAHVLCANAGISRLRCVPPTHYLYISIISRLGESVCTLPHAPHAGHGPVYVPTPLPPLATEYMRAELVLLSESRLDYLVLSGAPPRPTPGPTDTGGPPSVVGGGQSRQVRLRLSVFGAAVRGRPERAAALAPWELVRCVRMGVVLQRCRSRRSGVCVFALRGLRGWRRG